LTSTNGAEYQRFQDRLPAQKNALFRQLRQGAVGAVTAFHASRCGGF
jgi:hypothetical protein